MSFIIHHPELDFHGNKNHRIIKARLKNYRQ
jgi:hypothetical protein